MATMELHSLVDQPGKLPTIPKVTQHLIASFSSESVSAHEIAQMIAADPALSAKLLRLANSAYFHVSRTIGSVDDALMMLGFVMVRNLVLGNGMVVAFQNTPGMNLHQFWRYNLYTACAARWLAAKSNTNADLVFTLGLMHGIGQLQMHVVMPHTMEPLDARLNVFDAERAAMERQELGFHYGDVSAELARIWNFPDALVTALRDIPMPLQSEQFSVAAACVHLGAWRARTEVLAMDDDAVRASYPTELGKRLGVDPAWVAALADGADVMPPLKELAEGLDAMLG